ncbi:MAG: hypothetical protein ACREF7_00125, partial [Candidatus Saccharimonadales bacterium]
IRRILMKSFTKLAALGTSIVFVGVLMSSGLVGATGIGQIEGGSSNYTIANVSKGTGFSNTQSADACNVVEYRLHLYNPGPDPISDVKVEATINTMTPYTQYVSTATAFAPNSLSPQVNFQATLNLSSAQTQSYVKNSTVLLDSAGNVLKSSANGTLADTVTMGAGGIDIGSLGESVQEYLEFKAQVSCPNIPLTPTYACTALNVVSENDDTIKVSNFTTSQTNGATFTNATINWGDNSTPLTTTQLIGQTHQYTSTGTYTITATANFNVNGNTESATSQKCAQQVSFNPTPPPPSTLVNTGPGSVIGAFVGFTLAGTAGFMAFLRRKMVRG